MDLPTSAIFQLRRLVDLDRGIKTLSLGLGVSPRCPSAKIEQRGEICLLFFRQKQMDSLAYRLGPGHSVGLAIFL